MQGQGGELVSNGKPVGGIKHWSLNVDQAAIDVTPLGKPSGWRDFIPGPKTISMEMTFAFNGAEPSVFEEALTTGAPIAINADGLAIPAEDGQVMGFVTRVDNAANPIGNWQTVEFQLTGPTVRAVDSAPDCRWLIAQPEFLTAAIEERQFSILLRDLSETGALNMSIGRQEVKKTLTMGTLAAVCASDCDRLVVQTSDGIEFLAEIAPVDVKWERGKDAAVVTYAFVDHQAFLDALVKMNAAWFIPTELVINGGTLKKPIPQLKTSVQFYAENAKQGQTVVAMKLREGELCSTALRHETSGSE